MLLVSADVAVTEQATLTLPTLALEILHGSQRSDLNAAVDLVHTTNTHMAITGWNLGYPTVAISHDVIAGKITELSSVAIVSLSSHASSNLKHGPKIRQLVCHCE